jgi:hypothetical protein
MWSDSLDSGTMLRSGYVCEKSEIFSVVGIIAGAARRGRMIVAAAVTLVEPIDVP